MSDENQVTQYGGSNLASEEPLAVQLSRQPQNPGENVDEEFDEAQLADPEQVFEAPPADPEPGEEPVTGHEPPLEEGAAATQDEADDEDAQEAAESGDKA